MQESRVISIQVGLPRQLGNANSATRADGPWFSGIGKVPVVSSVWVGPTNLTGDGQADLENHGGPDKAVLVYHAGHYSRWRAELQRPDLPYGGFGENLTVTGFSEENVCIGDIYGLGPVRLQVSQPRSPCWKLARRWQVADLVARVQATGRTGWYSRVLTEGSIEPGLPITLLERPYPQWTVALASRIMARRTHDRDAAAALAACGLLSRSWRETLAMTKH